MEGVCTKYVPCSDLEFVFVVFSALHVAFKGTTIQTCHQKITINTNIITFNINIILLLILILTYCCVINQLLFLIKESSGGTFELYSLVKCHVKC